MQSDLIVHCIDKVSVCKTPTGQVSYVYGSDITDRMYEKLEILAKDVLNGGNSVVLLDSQQASTDELRRRIGQGLQGPQGVSEASLKVLE